MSFDTLLLTGKDFKPHLEFWTRQLHGLGEPFQFVREGEPPAASGPHGSMSLPLDAKSRAVVAKITGGKPLESFIILLAAWLLVLEKYTGKRGLSVATPLLAQAGDAPHNSDGIVYLLQNLDGVVTLKDLIIALNRGVTQSYQYQNFPLAFAAQREGLSDALYRSNLFLKFNNLHCNLLNFKKRLLR